MTQFVNFNSIIGNGKSYRVPIYQRDYSWDKEDWEDLWNDILEIPNDKNHYMGYLVLQPIPGEDQSYSIIDGQQRITTLSLLSLAITFTLKKWSEEGIEKEESRIRFEKITERYIGNFSLSGLTLKSKLKLNRNNDDFYQSYLTNLRRPASMSKLKPSQKLLQKAFDFFCEKLLNKFSNNPSGASLADFLEKTIGVGLVFTVIEVQNDLDAFKVFETLNARGVKLSTADLLKNYLFSLTAKIGQFELDEAERRWQNISDMLKKNDSTTFIRHYWNSRYSGNEPARQSTLFKKIKNDITSAEKAFDLLASLEKNVSYYSAFSEPNDEFWDKEERRYLKILNLLEVTTCYSLLLSGIEFLSRSEFKNLLRELSTITFRYNLSGLNPNEAERLFSKVAIEVAKKQLQTVKDISLKLKNIYVSDDSFEQAFSSLVLNTKRNKNLVKYILVQIENQISGTENNYEDASSTIEHILPENPGSVWDDHFSIDEQAEYIYRIGNYTLLEASINNKLSNDLSFAKKMESYKTSKYKISKESLNYEEWNPSSLSLRQEKMASWAKSIWKSNYI